jgi:hypothetical protein
MERRGRAFIDVARGRNGQGSKGELKGELTASSVGFRRDLRSREEEGDVAWLVGPTRQRGKGRTGGTVSGLILGRGRLLELGRKASRGPFSYFSLLNFFFFSVFLNSFIDFAKLLQINLNHFQRFYRNHCKVLSQ